MITYHHPKKLGIYNCYVLGVFKPRIEQQVVFVYLDNVKYDAFTLRKVKKKKALTPNLLSSVRAQNKF